MNISDVCCRLHQNQRKYFVGKKRRRRRNSRTKSLDVNVQFFWFVFQETQAWLSWADIPWTEGKLLQPGRIPTFWKKTILLKKKLWVGIWHNKWHSILHCDFSKTVTGQHILGFEKSVCHIYSHTNTQNHLDILVCGTVCPSVIKFSICVLCFVPD